MIAPGGTPGGVAVVRRGWQPAVQGDGSEEAVSLSVGPVSLVVRGLRGSGNFGSGAAHHFPSRIEE